MFSRHPGVAFWCHVCSQINKKTTMESVLPLRCPNDEKVTNMIQNWSQGGFKIHQKSTKIQIWSQGVLSGVIGSLQINKMVPRDTKITPRDAKMLPGRLKRCPRYTITKKKLCVHLLRQVFDGFWDLLGPTLDPCW